MTHTKFIELLNLYLDHQINREEADLLEAEIRQNPARRQLYRQYCRMQKGCSLLADNFREQAPAARVAGTVAFPSAARRRLVAWSTGLGAAAAACLALIMVNRPPESAEATATPLAQAESAPTVARNEPVLNRPMLALPAMPRSHQQLQTVFTSTSTAVDDGALAENAAPVLFTSDEIDRFDWMNHVQVAPVQLDDYSFQVRPSLSPENRTFRSRRPFQGKVEMTAFQFQR